MIIYHNVDELINYTSSLVGDQGKRFVISIDGINGSGKSYLASSLSSKNGYTYIDIDGDYLIQNNGKYINYIKYKNLSEKIKNLLNQQKTMVVDGICILQVLDRIDIKPDFKIYVKKFHLGFWRDGELFDYERNVEEHLAERRKRINKFEDIIAHVEGRKPDVNDTEEDMSHEIIRYHYEYKPDVNADIVFERDLSG